MRKFEVTEVEVKAAFEVAKSEEVKNVLAALFCKEEKPTPTLDDYTTIQSYEDACKVLRFSPIKQNDAGSIVNESGEFVCTLPPHIVALMKLETISKALWGRNFEPKPDAEGSKVFYYPCFALYTKDEIERMDEDDKGALLSAPAGNGASAGFGCLRTNNRSSDAGATCGFRLCQETSEKAKYFGKKFIKLWAEYLQFNFTTGDFLK